MSLEFLVSDVPVGTDWADLVTFSPKKFHSMIVYAEGALEIGSGGAGLPRASSEYFSLTWQDFDQKRLDTSKLTIRAKAPAGATNAVVCIITEV